MQKPPPSRWLHFSALLIAVCTGLNCFAQEPAAAGVPIHNTTFFVEVWGEGIYNSVNMEKTVTTTTMVNYHLRLGLGFWKPSVPVDFISLPVDAAVSYGRNVRIEFSMGATPIWADTNKKNRVSTVIAPNFGLHLRVQPRAGGFFLRAGALVAPLSGLNDIPGNEDLVEQGTWGWNPGLAMGVTF